MVQDRVGAEGGNMQKGKTPAEIQADMLDIYFKHLASYGYMDENRSMALLTGILLLDTLDFFSEYADDEYKEKIEGYLRKMNCCHCAIRWHKVTTTSCKDCIEDD